MLDLSALEQKEEPDNKKNTGKPLTLTLESIIEDPNQPRKDFSDSELKALADSIKQYGILQPIIVKIHPDNNEKWIIVLGARRYRASIIAGLESIPVIIRDSSDDFIQVVENELRDNLSPMELAQFIHKKIDEGYKKNEIAQKLSKSASIITEYLALIDCPSCIQAVYDDKRCTSPRTLYTLIKLYEQFPDEVESWCCVTENITRKTTDELSNCLKNSEPTNNLVETSQDESSIDTDSQSVKEKPTHDIKNEDQNNSDCDTDLNIDTKSFHPKINNPVLLVKHNELTALILMDREPSSNSMIWIKYIETNQIKEIEISKCVLLKLTDAQTL